MVVVFACLLAKTISMLTCRHTRSSFVPTCRLCYPSYAVRHLPFLYTLWLYTRRDIWRVGRRQHTSRGRVDAERAPNESAYGETCAWHIESNRRSRDELLWEINFWPSEVWKTLNRTHVYGARALNSHVTRTKNCLSYDTNLFWRVSLNLSIDWNRKKKIVRLENQEIFVSGLKVESC